MCLGHGDENKSPPIVKDSEAHFELDVSRIGITMINKRWRGDELAYAFGTCVLDGFRLGRDEYSSSTNCFQQATKHSAIRRLHANQLSVTKTTTTTKNTFG
jgi:hypothetical protein